MCRGRGAGCRGVDPRTQREERRSGVRADVTGEESCPELVTSAADKLGGVQVLVHNAGVEAAADPISPRMRRCSTYWHKSLGGGGDA
jgi:NAD(P)-dependent dehydrogenase (short-subunit alcohol dehydrogenase family)